MRHWFQGAFSDPIFRPNLSNNLTVAIGVGLVGGILLVFLFEHLDDTIKTSEEVENWVQAPVLGVIPLVASGSSLAPKRNTYFLIRR